MLNDRMPQPSNKYQIKVMDLGIRKFMVLKKLKEYCVVCKKETQQEFLFIPQKRGFPILIPFPFIFYRGGKTYPEFFGYRCKECSNTYPIQFDEKTRAEITIKYHVDSLPEVSDKINVIILKQLVDSKPI